LKSGLSKRLLFRPWAIGLALLCGLVMVPYAMPVLPVPAFVKYNEAIGSFLHLKFMQTENHRDGPLPQDWSDMHGWPELTALVAKVVSSLSPEERAKAVIVAENYGEAGALEFFGKAQNLPPVLSGHNQYFLWGPRGNLGEVLIDVNGDCGKSIQLYRSATLAAVFSNPLVMPHENNIPIMICRGPTKDLKDILAEYKEILVTKATHYLANRVKPVGICPPIRLRG